MWKFWTQESFQIVRCRVWSSEWMYWIHFSPSQDFIAAIARLAAMFVVSKGNATSAYRCLPVSKASTWLWRFTLSRAAFQPIEQCKTRIAERRYLTGLQRGYFFWREGAAIHTQATIKPCQQPLHATEPHVRLTLLKDFHNKKKKYHF